MVYRFFLLLLTGFVFVSPQAVFAQLPNYIPSTDVQQGQLVSVGSDTLRIVMERWREAFQQLHSGIEISISSKGSATAPPALTEGSSTLAPMSREMTETEIKAFEEKYGYPPMAIKVAIDALAIYVNKSNPLRGITLKQLDGIFSKDRKCGGGAITQWGEMIYGPLSDKSIKTFGRNKLSGTFAVFENIALCGGDFNAQVMALEDSKAIITAVENDIAAIGYSGLGYRSSGVRPISVGRNPDGPYFPFYVEKYKDDPNFQKRYQYVVNGDYPLARILYIYVNKKPGEELPVNETAFIRFVLSAQGQKLVHETGYIPLPEKKVEHELKKLDADYKPSWWTFDD